MTPLRLRLHPLLFLVTLSILLAPDSLKGALSAAAACAAMERGARRALGAMPCRFTAVPLADGGEGTIEAFLRGAGGQARTATVRGPLGDATEAQWAILSGGCALIEMAQASGLTLVPSESRDAARASSHGTGELIRAALDAGCSALLVGIGGSATTDGGAGALQALGLRLLNRHEVELSSGGAALQHLAAIDDSALDARLAQTDIRVLCDVTNPLCGAQGAARVYGPQKGASRAEVETLDAALNHFADVATQTTKCDLRDEPGAGAAGGIGWGLMTFCGARLTPGIEAVLEATKFHNKLESSDLVLTAEGSIDAQTPQGKTLAGVARAARGAKNGQGVPVIAFGGAVRLSGEALRQMGIMAALPLPNAPLSLQESIARTDELLADAVERALRLWLLSTQS